MGGPDNPPAISRHTKENKMKKSLLLAASLALCAHAVPALAQEPTKVDPKHYKVEFENDKVRVLRVTYGPKEKSVMHEHPDATAIFLTDSNVRMTLPDGKTVDNPVKAGSAVFTPAGKHLPTNLTDKPFELILVELKDKPAAKK
jgi:quercetin dioxygenase-like cupin family protein